MWQTINKMLNKIMTFKVVSILEWKKALSLFIFLPILVVVLAFHMEIMSYVKFRKLCLNESGFVVNERVLKNKVWQATNYFNALALAQYHPKIKFVRFYTESNTTERQDLHYMSGFKKDRSSYEVRNVDRSVHANYKLGIDVDYLGSNNFIKKVTYKVVKLNPRQETGTLYAMYNFNYKDTRLFKVLLKNKPKLSQCSSVSGFFKGFDEIFVK